MSLEVQKFILLGEEYEDDVLLFRRSAERAGLNTEILWLDTPGQIQGYLAGAEAYADRTVYPLPVLIFLNAQLQHCPTLPLLQWLRANPATRHIPIIVSTASLDARFCQQVITMGALACFGKPLSAEDWLKLKARLQHTDAASLFLEIP